MIPMAPAEMTKEYLVLKIRWLLESKAHANARANFDTTRYGEWMSNYDEWHSEIDGELKELFAALAAKEQSN